MRGHRPRSAGFAQLTSLPGCDLGVLFGLWERRWELDFLRGPARRALWVGKITAALELLRPGPAKTLASQGARSADWVGRASDGAGAVMGAQTRVSRLRRLLETGRFSAEH